MNNTRGLTLVTTLLIVLGFIVVGGTGYIAMNPQLLQAPAGQTATDDGVQTAPGDHPEVDHEANDGVATKSSIVWRFDSVAEVDGIPQTKVTAVINGTAYAAGTFGGSCSEVGASGGIDGKGLLTGELSAAQCWFAGGGNEIGIFAHEDGGFEIMVGELSEGEPEAPMFRGNFKVKTSVQL